MQSIPFFIVGKGTADEKSRICYFMVAVGALDIYSLRLHNGTIMKTITIKRIPDDIYGKLKQRAAENRRSINSEIIICIERSVQSHLPDNIDTVLEKARQIRARTKTDVITDDEFNTMKSADRR